MIPQTFDEAFEEVKHRVSIFTQNQKKYLEPSYSEAEARKDFIDKFWIALGWDVNHDTQTNPYEQEVKVERSVNVSQSRKRADYAFLAPNFRDVRFYVEAKKPSVQLENKDHYFQTIRYGWNSNTPLAVLTDFEQFHILDCRFKPDVNTSLYRVLKKYHFSDYTDRTKFAEIYYLFSRQAVHSGAIEKYAESLPKPTGKARQKALFPIGGYQEVDESFLQKLDDYREELARSFKLRNPHLESEDLTEITQRTLDRLVFIRFLEDKLIETEPIVANFGNKSTVWQDFIATSARLDKIYNGIIFKKHEILDAPTFKADEKVFNDICEELSHANSPYDFNSIPIHILGSIYERFLGKTIVATDKRATVQEKPEVRKAGGVYYTPEYIVRYIVENTVGKLIAGKKPAEISEMRFADISCGSGSFLLGVYDLLLRYHTAYYNKNQTRRKEGVKAGCREGGNGALSLSLWQRRDILLNNIYGVDIDAQAVEVAQLSLYLKMLEDETTASAKAVQLELREALLPSLTKNIICGNSLIGWDILDGKLFETKEERKLNPMDFMDKFPQIIKAGGFDAIVGNPPYGAELKPIERVYLSNKFKLGTTDTAALMMIQATKLAKQNNRIGLIVPKPFTYSSTWEQTRGRLIERLTELVDAGKVWKNVKLEQVICVFDSSAEQYYRSLKRAGEKFIYLCNVHKSATSIFGFYLNGLSEEEIAIGQKIQNIGGYLGNLVTNTRGGMFQDKVIQQASRLRVIGGKQIQRYRFVGEKGFISSSQELSANAFVAKNSLLIQNIVAHIANPIDHIKIIGAVAYDCEANNIVILDTVNQLLNLSTISSHYLLALLHSRLLNWYVYRFIFAKAIRTMHFDAPVSNRIPIRIINFSKQADKARHDRMVQLVEQIIEAKKLLAKVSSDKDKAYYEGKCAALDRQIDTLVYELYGLTDDEINIVEES